MSMRLSLAALLCGALCLLPRLLPGAGAAIPAGGDDAIAMIDRSLAGKALSANERAVLRGLRWCVEFASDDDNFDFIFTDYVQMLNELTLNKKSPAVAAAARCEALAALGRAQKRLAEIFEGSHRGKWDFISVIPFLYKYGRDSEAYRAFYRGHFPAGEGSYHAKTFDEACRERDYDVLMDYLIEQSYVSYARSAFPGKASFALPPNRLADYLERATAIGFTKRAADADGYHDQNYYATHLVFVLCYYGERAFGDGDMERGILRYLESNYATVRYRIGDIDLLAEYIQCFKIYGKGDSPVVREGIAYLLKRQNADGSWGRPQDPDNDPYDAFHPTWTVITALNQAE